MNTEGYFMTVESTNARTGAGISRRRLVKGAAWATPAVLIATAAPAAANGSGQFAPTLVLTRGGTGVTRSATLIHRDDNASAHDITSVTLTFYVKLILNGKTYASVASNDISSYSADGWSEPEFGVSPVDASVGTISFVWSTDLADDDDASDVTLTFKSGNRPTYLDGDAAMDAFGTSNGGAISVTYL